MIRALGKIINTGLPVLICLLLLPEPARAEEPIPLATPADMVNYGIGVEVVRNLRRQGTEMNLDLVTRGMKDALANEKLLLTDKEIRKAMNAFQAELRRRQARKSMVAADENKEAGAVFMAENRKQDGVTMLPNGVQYRVIRAGSGRKPADTDTLSVNYQGTLLDGTEFDSTEPEHPASLKLVQLIPGLREAVKLMPAGSIWQIAVPPQLAYGRRGSGSIGPNATLLFEVELLAIL